MADEDEVQPVAEDVFEMQPVSSSQIAAVGYNAKTRQMRVRFLHQGSLYEYDNVSQETFDQLVSAGSVGSAFHNLIKNNSSHPYKRIA